MAYRNSWQKINFKSLVTNFNPNFLWLIETKAIEPHMRFLQQSLNYHHSVIIPSNGLEVFSPTSVLNKWIICFVYGPPCFNEKECFWFHLFGIIYSYEGEWLCIGDWNDINSQNDKKGINLYMYNSKMKMFVDNFKGLDIHFIGSSFT